MPELRELGWLVGLGAATIGLFVALIRQIGPWRKQITEAEERLRTELRHELETERAAHAAERATYTAELRVYVLERDELGDRIAKLERTIDRQQLRHNAERAIYRHKFKNIASAFDAMLLLLEMNPDRADEIVEKIKAMRARDLLAEAKEEAILRATEITADEHASDGK
jgi:predicted component of viral defense system (DUF524 family)